MQLNNIMGVSKSKLKKIDINNIKPFLHGKFLKCKVLEVYNYHTYKILFKYNKEYITWDCCISEVIKNMVDRNDNRMSSLIRKNQELFVFFHGLRESILIVDFYIKKKSKQTINQLIVDQKQKEFYQMCYRNSFKKINSTKNTVIEQPKQNINITPVILDTEPTSSIYPNLESIITEVKESPNNSNVNEPENKQKFNTQRKTKTNFLDELRKKQKSFRT